MASHSLDVLAALPLVVPARLAELTAAWDPAAAPAAPRLAASVVLCRDTTDGLQTYLLHRHARMAFAASMVVFPGGGLDPVDEPTADPLRACAVRETAEETGVQLTPADLVPWAHWTTPEPQPIRYDTYFYVAGLPAGQIAADLSTETEHAVWTRPDAALEAYAEGTIALMPPTQSILIEVAAVSSVADLMAQGRGRVIESVLPVVVREGDGWAYRYPSRRDHQ